MRKFLMISSLALGAAAAVATPAQARGTYGEWGTELRFVAETEIPAGTAGGQTCRFATSWTTSISFLFQCIPSPRTTHCPTMAAQVNDTAS